jgi:hypothetical protein
MSNARSLLVAATAILVLAPGGSFLGAHHSFAMFDTANPITISGTVTAFEWTNPHVYIELDVPEGQAMKHWAIELGSPSILMRGGWKFNTIKKGDRITAVVSPLRNGEPGSLLNRVTLADGRVLGNGGPAGIGPGTPPTVPAPSAPPR